MRVAASVDIVSEALARGCGSRGLVRASLFEQHGFVRLLELPPPSSSSQFPLLQNREGASLEPIHGVVTPDLPIKASLVEFLQTFDISHVRQLLQHTKSTKEEKQNRSVAESHSGIGNGLQGFNCWKVNTVAAQTRSMPEICKRMVNSAQEIDSAGSGGALLLLSGGHPARRLWLANHLLPANAFAMLRTAQKLRESGLLPPGVQLWSVENPLINSTDRLEKKIDAGTEAVIVQPPLLPDRFAKWWSKAQQKGLTKAVPVIVGLPLLSSSRNYAFWLQLTQASGSLKQLHKNYDPATVRVVGALSDLSNRNESDAILARWRRAEAEFANDPPAMVAFCNKQTVQLIETIKDLPGVAGIHVMPVTRAGWRQFQTLVAEKRL